MMEENELERTARALISVIKITEKANNRRAHRAVLSIEIELTTGEVETWQITVERAKN